MAIKNQCFFEGNWQSVNGDEFFNVDPVNNCQVQAFNEATKDNAHAAVLSAQQAYSTYSELSGKKRAALLCAIADEIENLGDELLNTANLETGLGLVRLTGERGRTCNQIRAFSNLLKEGHWLQASIDTSDVNRVPPKPDLRRMMRPIGPVTIFPASNFPLAFGVLGGDTASALAAGNSVVIKAHPAHPATSELCMQAAYKAMVKTGVPLTTISMLQGQSIELAQALVTAPAIAAVGFTGSLRAGRAIMDVAAARPIPIPVYAEMGSINPVFITPDTLADKGEQIASGLANSVAMGTGQFCTSPGLVVTLADEAFTEQLSQALNLAPQGNLLHPSIASGLKQRVESLKNNNTTHLITGGGSVDDAFLRPQNTLITVSGKDFIIQPELLEEAFGPVTLRVSCDNPQEILDVARVLNGNLTATIHGDNDDELSQDLAKILQQKVGRLLFNGYPTGVEVCASQQHGGPYPACSLAAGTSVGTDAIVRFTRFVAYQDAPQNLLPVELQDSNTLGILRLVNGKHSSQTL